MMDLNWNYENEGCIHLPGQSDIRLSGRILVCEEVYYLSHAASFIEFSLEGKLLELEMESEEGEDIYQAWIGIFIEDMKHPYMRFPLKAGKHRYRIFEEANTEKKKIRIVKLSENQYAYAAVSGIITDKEATIKGTVPLSGRIEFIGDSLTCGYGNESGPSDVFSTKTENPLRAYGVLTAEKLDCEYSLVAWSGSGILSRWIPDTEERPDTEGLVPDLYRFTDLLLCTKKGFEALEKKDYYAQNECDIIVINLGTNDSSYTREDHERRKSFQSAYEKFLFELCNQHKGKPIICTANAMNDLLNYEIEAAVNEVRSDRPEEQLFYMQFSMPLEYENSGADGHPSLDRHEKMAVQLAAWIRENKIL